MIISIEGPETVGKTTVVNELKKHIGVLKGMPPRTDVVFHSEPSRDCNIVAPGIRNLCVNTSTNVISPKTHFLLYFSARVNLVTWLAKEHYGAYSKTKMLREDDSKLFIFDRYITSTFIIQKAAGLWDGIISDAHRLFSIPFANLDIRLVPHNYEVLKPYMPVSGDGRMWEKWFMEGNRLERHVADYKTNKFSNDEVVFIETIGANGERVDLKTVVGKVIDAILEYSSKGEVR